ncbi:hypothetical protein [uncultured Dysosmobacter sp.]|uniref:hypothetical protein n=1 Tax=uncultured Dysosmobacter sp. TaxID=2591384 RepID=UPI0026392808|nr:hypothetical protein [uncultured Dysosmobacter sp.]
MRRVKRYRGKKPRGGLSPETVMLIAVLAMMAILTMTMRINRQWTGRSVRGQLYQAVFVTPDG